MFVTKPNDKIVGPVSIDGEEFTTWRRITVELYAPYYIVEYTVREGDYELRDTVMVHFPSDLVAICMQVKDDPRLLVNSVSRLSPKKGPKRAGWKLEEIQEIWQQGSDNSAPNFVFRNRNHLAKKMSQEATLLWSNKSSH